MNEALPVEVGGKRPASSKTLWLNAVAVFLVQIIPPGVSSKWLISLLFAANLYLRFKTKEPIQMKRGMSSEGELCAALEKASHSQCQCRNS